MRKRLDGMVEKTAASKRTAVIWLEEFRCNRGERWEDCPSVAPMFLFKPAVSSRPQNGVSVQIIDKFPTLKSRLPHIRPSIASPSSQQPSSATLRPSSASTPPSRCARASPSAAGLTTATLRHHSPQIHHSPASPQPFSFFASFCALLRPNPFPLSLSAPHRTTCTHPTALFRLFPPPPEKPLASCPSIPHTSRRSKFSQLGEHLVLFPAGLPKFPRPLR